MKPGYKFFKLAIFLFLFPFGIIKSKPYNLSLIESMTLDFTVISEQNNLSSPDTTGWGNFMIDTVNTYLRVRFGNSLWDATIRVNDGGKCGKEHAIRDWVVKSTGVDHVNLYLDACAQRGPLKNVKLIDMSETECRFRLEYHHCSSSAIEHILEYTFYPDSNVVKIDYLKYTSWANIVDLGTPGGKSNNLNNGTTKLVGQDYFIRPIQYHEKSYWNLHDAADYPNDPVDGGCLNYGGHIIMAVEGAGTNTGFARVLPVREPGTGGINLIKLLWNRGFESFISTGQAERKPLTSYLYMYDRGIDTALETGKNLVELKTGLSNIEECTTAVSVKNVEVINKPVRNFYPNPVNSHVNIDIELIQQAEIDITVFDIVGKSIITLSNKIYLSGMSSESFSLKMLPKGIYFLKVSLNNRQVQTERLIKII